MDDQLINMIRDQFKVMNDKVDGLHDAVKEHVEKDERYWSKIDQQDGQMTLLKFLLGPGIVGFFGWLYNQFLRH